MKKTKKKKIQMGSESVSLRAFEAFLFTSCGYLLKL
jgi:hypothetical protein